jgi:flagellar hook-length control protein FliK
MMASIPNMRSTPLPIPAAKGQPAGDPASGDFAAQMPAAPEQAPATPGQPCLVVPPILSPADLLDGLVPHVAAPEGNEDGDAGGDDDAAPAQAETKDDAEAQPALVIPFVQPQVLAAPVPQAPPVIAGTEVPPPQTAGAAPIPLPIASGGTGKKSVQAPDLPDAPKAEQEAEADAPALESAVKALLQRKPLTTKQVGAPPKAEVADTARADPAPVKAAQKQVAASPAPVAIPTAAPAPSTELPQPALSPAATQPVTAAGEKTSTVDGTRTADLAVERKLDLARDGQWLDRLARDIARAASDDSPLRFRLHPQTLGSLHVELQKSDRGTAVRMTVDTETARQILADAQPRLAAEARAQGVRIAETHVDLSGSGRHAPGDQRRQDEARQTPLIRTATGAGAEADAAARASRRARLDRYA